MLKGRPAIILRDFLICWNKKMLTHCHGEPLICWTAYFMLIFWYADILTCKPTDMLTYWKSYTMDYWPADWQRPANILTLWYNDTLTWRAEISYDEAVTCLHDDMQTCKDAYRLADKLKVKDSDMMTLWYPDQLISWSSDTLIFWHANVQTC